MFFLFQDTGPAIKYPEIPVAADTSFMAQDPSIVTVKRTAPPAPHFVPASQPEVPASQPEVPASQPDVPASQTEVPASQTEVPASQTVEVEVHARQHEKTPPPSVAEQFLEPPLEHPLRRRSPRGQTTPFEYLMSKVS